jgi:hypothetical protein
METIKEVLMKRDGITENEADDLIAEVVAELNYRLANNEDAFDICHEYLGLEPDYLIELLY